MTKPPIRKVILCADGDSNDIDSWSNIPYLLASELERQGIELIRVNLQAPLLLRRLWRYILGPRHKLRHWQTSYDFFRSRTNHWFTTYTLNQAVRRHGGPGTLLINLSISAAPTLTTIPVVLISDWSYHHYITERLGRSPDRSERGTIQRDNAAMLRATLVGLLFPESAARLQRQLPAAQVRFLGHVINSHPLAPAPPPKPPAAAPHHPWRLLFVGRPRYLEGLHLLCRALARFPSPKDVELDVIGIHPQDAASLPGVGSTIRLHGYLSKADSQQRHLYYQLLNQADLIINASRRWGGFSATVEAMHRRTAVLTPPYAEFTNLFGDSIPFGGYCSELHPDALASAIQAQLENPGKLAARQDAAHQAVQTMTWTAFVEQLWDQLALVRRAAHA